MSNTVILLYAIGVFTLMLIGIYLTAEEFKRLAKEQSQSQDRRENDSSSKDAQQTTERPERADIRVVHHNNNAA